MPARIRIPSWAVWEVAVFVLNVLAFILVGFQLKSIAARVTGADGGALRDGGGGGVRRGHPRAHRVGDRGGGVQPVALPSARDGTPGPRDAVALDAPRGARWWGGAACAAP